MATLDTLKAFLQRHEDERRDKLDAALSDLIWTTDASNLPRVIRNEYCPIGQGFMVSGAMFSDGLPRLVVNPKQFIREDKIKWE